MPNLTFHAMSWLVAIALIGSLNEVANAQKKASPARLAVDLVTLDSGRLRGAFLGVDADGIVTMAVQRSWLKSTRPARYEELVGHEAAEAKAAAMQLLDRIRSWLDEKPKSNALVTFLEVEVERVEARLAKLDARAGDSQFVLVKFPRRAAKYSFAQPPQNRRIAMLAWRERLDDVETREAADLEKQLRDAGIDPATDVPDLADRLPPALQDETEWAARRAVVEFELADKLEFQGIGNALVRTDGGAAKVGLEQLLPELLPQLLQDQPGGQLADLLQEPGLNPRRGNKTSTPDFSGAIRQAERSGTNGFRVTTVDLNLQQKRANVETRFLAKLPSGKWETIWSHQAAGDTSKPRPDIQRQIENDPQVAEALKLAKSLGLGAGGQLQTAMNFGAATMEAQKIADQAFFHFLDRYVQHLDGPRLDWVSDGKATK
jgi:hypothetical protein